MIRKTQKGFTLVELLIVVAIIGVLATVGVPTYKKMVQKAKKSEAKVGLGGLYTAEAAFYSEYNTYGNNLDRIGFELEGNGTGRLYTVGFPDPASCGNATIVPDPTAGTGLQLIAVFPNYYPGGTTTASDLTTPPNPNRTRYLALVNTPGKCEANSLVSSATVNTFQASATGKISPNADTTVLSQMDTWTINNDRALVNVNDGVR